MARAPAFLVAVALAAMVAAIAAEHLDEYAGNYAEATCDDPPSPSSSSATTAAAFRADLLALLAALPAAAAPTGFASLRRSSSGSGDAAAFARGLCYGASPPGSSCAACLSGAARKAAGCAGSGSRRGGVWSPGCALAFADTNASSPNEASYRACLFVFSSPSGDDSPRSPAFYDDARATSALALSLALQAADSSSGPMLATAATDMAQKKKKIKVHAVAQCARDRAAADCGECLRESARELPRCWGREAGRSEGVAAVSVVGYNCYLRLEMYAPAPPFSKILWTFVKNNAVVFILLAVIVGTVPLGSRRSGMCPGAAVLRRRSCRRWTFQRVGSGWLP